jgi:hypothetical protein
MASVPSIDDPQSVLGGDVEELVYYLKNFRPELTVLGTFRLKTQRGCETC